MFPREIHLILVIFPKLETNDLEKTLTTRIPFKNIYTVPSCRQRNCFDKKSIKNISKPKILVPVEEAKKVKLEKISESQVKKSQVKGWVKKDDKEILLKLEDLEFLDITYWKCSTCDRFFEVHPFINDHSHADPECLECMNLY